MPQLKLIIASYPGPLGPWVQQDLLYRQSTDLVNSTVRRQIVHTLESSKLFSLLFRVMMIYIATFEFTALLEEARLGFCRQGIFISMRRWDAVFTCIPLQGHVVLQGSEVHKLQKFNWSETDAQTRSSLTFNVPCFTELSFQVLLPEE